VDYPVPHAMTQNNLGNAYATLAKVRDTEENCQLAITAFQEALKILNLELYPEMHKIGQENLEKAQGFCAGSSKK